MPTDQPRRRRVLRWAGQALLFLAGLFLVARAAVELIAVDPSRPQTYRADWGGPSYVGVLLVHAGPGIAVLVLAACYLIRRRRQAINGDWPSSRRSQSG